MQKTLFSMYHQEHHLDLKQHSHLHYSLSRIKLQLNTI
uniref:Uncharacterized protein n=1 Tax=Rhizophora mucronata TaxID=61149 RepID=A0A2P2QZS7_RHIMU